MALSKTVETMCTTMHMEPCDRCKKQVRIHPRHPCLSTSSLEFRVKNYRARNDTPSPLYMSYVRQGMMLQCDLLRVYSDLCKVVINARPPLARVCIFMPS